MDAEDVAYFESLEVRVTELPETKVAECLKKIGATTYYVGGCLRDAFMQLPVKDTDLLVRGAAVEAVAEALVGMGARVDLVGQSFGVLKVGLDGVVLDVAFPRTERSTGPGRRDFEVSVDPFMPIEQDLARRDLTCGAMALEVGKDPAEALIDLFGGRQDIRDGILREVGNPAERFAEDSLRIMRVFRFKARFGFHIALGTQRGIQECANYLKHTAAERIGDELSGLLMGKSGLHVRTALQDMIDLGVMAQVIPEFMESVGFEQHNVHHIYTVEAHVLSALEWAVDHGASLRARWAVLLHDIAKPRTFTMDEGRGHFLRHEDMGDPMAQEILRRLRRPEDFVVQVGKIVGEHLNPGREATRKSLRRYAAKMGDLVEDGVMCRAADLHAHATVEGFEAGAWMEKTLADIREHAGAVTGFTQAKLALDGNRIAELFGVSGAGIGALKKRATQAVVDGLVENDEAKLVGFLRDNPQ